MRGSRLETIERGERESDTNKQQHAAAGSNFSIAVSCNRCHSAELTAVQGLSLLRLQLSQSRRTPAFTPALIAIAQSPATRRPCYFLRRRNTAMLFQTWVWKFSNWDILLPSLLAESVNISNIHASGSRSRIFRRLQVWRHTVRLMEAGDNLVGALCRLRDSFKMKVKMRSSRSSKKLQQGACSVTSCVRQPSVSTPPWMQLQRPQIIKERVTRHLAVV